MPALMFRSCPVVGFALLCLATPRLALAQEDEPADAATSEEEGATPLASVASAEEGEDRFVIRRGFYVTGDFGGYFTLGGEGYNAQPQFVGVPEQEFSSQSVSNFQPQVAITAGYDLVSSPGFNLGLGLRLALLFNDSSSQVTAEEIQNLGRDADGRPIARQVPEGFGVGQVGVSTKLGFMVSDRVAINGLVDAGLALVAPDPGSIEGGLGIGFAFGGGVGVEYATRLPGVSVGLEGRFIGTIVSDRFIPGISISAPLKYNF